MSTDAPIIDGACFFYAHELEIVRKVGVVTKELVTLCCIPVACFVIGGMAGRL